ncbi:MAG: AIPR family protein, partial [Candidatus Cloacimonetes bacterium]|nr:AIPR family protein [Candidatus Cloacimonadota bacterium]
MELEEFRNDLLQSTNLGAVANMEFNRSEFVQTIANDLIEFEECSDFVPCYYEGIGLKGKKIEIDGYNYDEDDKTFSIFICYYSAKKELTTITRTDVDKLVDRSIAFIDESFSGIIQKNADESSMGYELSTYISDLRDSIERYRIYVITDCVKSDRIKTLDIDRIDDKISMLSLWDISNIFNLKISKLGYKDLEINLKNFGSDGIPCIKACEASKTVKYESYLCIIPGKLLSDLFEKYGGKLLEANVRSFLRFTNKTNKYIRATILKEPDMFFAYNNGISTTATNIVVENRYNGSFITDITSLQIVNGGQTTVSIYTVGKSKDKPDLTPIFVPMKISVIPTKEAEEIVPVISRSANTQTKVSESDFFSNHPFHRQMEKYSRNIRAPSATGIAYTTRWYYERARGQYQQDQLSLTSSDATKFKLENPKSQYFTKTDLAKFWNSYECHPDIVSRGAQYSFNKYAEDISSSYGTDGSKYNETYFKESVALAILFRTTQDIVSNRPWYTGGYRANVVTYTIAKISDIVSKRGGSIDLIKIWDQQSLSEPLKEQIITVSKYVYDSITQDNEEPNVGQWCKKLLCWSKIKDITIELYPGVEKCLISEKKENWQ